MYIYIYIDGVQKIELIRIIHGFLLFANPGFWKPYLLIGWNRWRVTNKQMDTNMVETKQSGHIYITVEAVLPSIKSRWWCPSYKSVSKPNEHHSLTIYPTIYNHICPIEPNTSILLSFASAGRTSHYSLKLKDPQPKGVSTQRWIAKDGHHRIFVGIS